MREERDEEALAEMGSNSQRVLSLFSQVSWRR